MGDLSCQTSKQTSIDEKLLMSLMLFFTGDHGSNMWESLDTSINKQYKCHGCSYSGSAGILHLYSP